MISWKLSLDLFAGLTIGAGSMGCWPSAAIRSPSRTRASTGSDSSWVERWLRADSS
jgi:hypothetical protein